MSLVTSGSCWCGSCGYSYTGEPAVKAICHCITCRKICGGTNTVNFAVPEGNFTVTKGALKHFSKEHEFGMMLAIFFCTECGTTLWKEATCDALKGMKLVQAGTLDNKKLLSEAIKVEMYTTERVPWLASIDGAAQVKLF